MGDMDSMNIFISEIPPEEMHQVGRNEDEVLELLSGFSTPLDEFSSEEYEFSGRESENIGEDERTVYNHLQLNRHPERSSSKRSNAHTQLRGEKRKMLETFLKVSDGNIETDVVVDTFGISKRYATTLIQQYRRIGTLAECRNKRGRKPLLDDKVVGFIRNLVSENSLITNKEIAEQVKEKFQMKDAPSKSSIYQCRRRALADVNKGSWQMKKWSLPGRRPGRQPTKLCVEDISMDMIGAETQNCLKVFIVETSFDFVRKEKKSTSVLKNTAMVLDKAKLQVTFHAIVAISQRGVEKYSVLEGQPLTDRLFTSFFRELVEGIGETRCYFFMDNNQTHNKKDLGDIMQATNHVLRYSTPCAPVLRPAYNFIRLWESRVMTDLERMSTMKDVHDGIRKSITSIEVRDVAELIDQITNAMTKAAMEFRLL